MVHRDLAIVKRIAARKQHTAQVNRSRRAHANVWAGQALHFRGFSAQRQFSSGVGG